jgi:hypothetical protein
MSIVVDKISKPKLSLYGKETGSAADARKQPSRMMEAAERRAR